MLFFRKNLSPTQNLLAEKNIQRQKLLKNTKTSTIGIMTKWSVCVCVCLCVCVCVCACVCVLTGWLCSPLAGKMLHLRSAGNDDSVWLPTFWSEMFYLTLCLVGFKACFDGHHECVASNKSRLKTLSFQSKQTWTLAPSERQVNSPRPGKKGRWRCGIVSKETLLRG